MAKTIFRADNCAFTKNPAYLKSAKYFDASDDVAAIENGKLVEIGGLLDGEREVHKVTEATPTSKYVGIVCTPELEYDESGYHGLDTYENKADQVIRVGVLAKGDIYSVTEGGFATVPAIGDDIDIADEVKGKCIAIDTVDKFTFYVVEVQ